MNVTQMNRVANNLRILIMEMVEKANSGHPGGAMGGADFVNTLYSRFMVYDPADPNWISRDRFFLDPGHMSTMLYSVLALTGKYTIDDLKSFRQWDSVTPGHPEIDVARGVENASGPLGQGHAMAVGAAIAERFICAHFGEVWSHKTYAYISDGGVQEEVSQGAGRLAGTLGLSNLIMFYDSNNVQLSTKVDQVSVEDTAAKYRAWGWNVIEINGNDPEQIASALDKAHQEKERPTLIIGKTTMSLGVLAKDGSSMEGFVNTHGQPLSKAGADVDATLKNLGGDINDPWAIFDESKELYAQRNKELSKIVSERRAAQRRWAEEHPEDMAELNNWIEGKLPELDFDSIEYKPNSASRATSAAVLGFLAERVKNMIVSSADLCNSDKTDGFLKKSREIVKGDFGGGFMQAGVAELTMACVMNGIVLHGGMQAACGTFFVFSDYEKPAIRMAALMELPVNFIFSHDSFRVGEDGPTHQPIEHEAQIRLLEQMKNFNGKPAALVLRPADAAETVEAYRLAMNNQDSPSILILSRQDLKDLPGENRREQAKQMEKGGYVVMTAENPQVILVGNGSDASLLCEVYGALAAEGIPSRVVSVPSLGLFESQDEAYKKEVIPDGVKIFGLTSGLPSTLYPIMKGNWHVYGLNRFGASAPAKVLDDKFGYTVKNIFKNVKTFLEL